MSGMSDETTTPAAPSNRAGSGADLAARMDRMERRQDNMETTLASLSGTVARVELNQKHAEELNLLRHDALKTGLDNLTGTVGAFIARIEGIIDGTIETSQSRQASQIMGDYLKWHDRVEAHIDESEKFHLAAVNRSEGVGIVLTGTKAFILTAAAVASPIIAIIVALTR